MSSKVKVPLIPKLRFPEFQSAGEWAKEKLGSFASISTAKVGDKICVPMSITSGVGLVSQQDKFGRVIAGSSYKNYLLLRPNDFAYNKSATKEYPEGFLALYSGDKLACVPNSIFTCFRIKGDSPAPRYLNFLFLGNLHGQWLRNFIQVGARAHGSLSINDSDLLALPVPLPKGKSSLAEQQKIADCLSSLDELIAAQARKVDALKTHKKGLMQQLFPREGEAQPRRRFPEFRDAGEWEVRALSSFCKVGDIDHKMPSSVIDGIPYIMTGNFFGINGIDFDNAKKVSTKDYERLIKKIKPEFGDIVIARYASVGAVRYIETKSKFLVSYSCAIVKCNGSEDSKYLYYILQSDVIQSKIGLEINASSQKNIGIDSIKKLNIFLPTLPEQQRIADCLTSLDTLITAATQKLETLKTHKKGLMQQLFPLDGGD